MFIWVVAQCCKCPRPRLSLVMINGVPRYLFQKARAVEFGKALAVALVLGMAGFWILRHYNLSGVREANAGFAFGKTTFSSNINQLTGIVWGILFGLARQKFFCGSVMALLFPCFFVSFLLVPAYHSYPIDSEKAHHLSFVVHGDVQDEIIQVSFQINSRSWFRYGENNQAKNILTSNSMSFWRSSVRMVQTPQRTVSILFKLFVLATTRN